MRDEQHSDELKDLRILRGLSKGDPFVAPDGFFDHFPHTVQQRIVDAHRPSPLAGLFSSWVPRTAIATVLLLLVGTIVWFQWPDSDPGNATAEHGEQVLPDELLDMDFDGDLIFATLADEEPVMNTVDLALTECEMTTYVEYEELSVELLFEEL